ncbi:hypothetical protein B0H10DRAFT_1972914 [Mycena sp. CBHHK59/15]|nr:hypothetical protein B0H10DRAFT_1972914 [Mycena sp. CBHHK59/15]
MPELPEAVASGTLPQVFIHKQPEGSLVVKEILADATSQMMSSTGPAARNTVPRRIRTMRGIRGQMMMMNEEDPEEEEDEPDLGPEDGEDGTDDSTPADYFSPQLIHYVVIFIEHGGSHSIL